MSRIVLLPLVFAASVWSGWEPLYAPGGYPTQKVFAEGGTVLATTYRSLYASQDEAGSWSNYDFGPTTIFPGVGGGPSVMGFHGGAFYASIGREHREEPPDCFDCGFITVHYVEVWRSLDSGRTFKMMFEEKGYPFNAFVSTPWGFFAGRDDNVNTLYRLSDDGSTFQAQPGAMTYLRGGFALQGNTVYAATAFGVRKSTGGGPWTLVGLGIWGSSIAADSEGLFLSLAQRYGNNPSRLAHSADGGVTWDTLTPALPPSTYITDVKLRGSAMFIGTTGGLYRSFDRGQTCTFLENAVAKTTVTSLDVDGEKLYLSTDPGGVFRSDDDGETWSQKTEGFFPNDAQSLAFAGGHLFVGTACGLFRDNGYRQPWTVVNRGLGDLNVGQLFAQEGSLYLGGPSGGYQSLDLGNSWFPFRANLPSGRIRAALVSGKRIFIGSDSGLFMTENQGGTWRRMGEAAWPIMGLAESDGFIFATAKHPFTGSGVLLRSADEGETWIRRDDGLNLAYGLGALVAKAGHLFTTNLTAASLYHSDDDGGTWVRVPGDPGFRIQAMAAGYDHLFAAPVSGSGPTSSNGVHARSWDDILKALTSP